ncbi:hypothetical protein TNCV_4426901 [Trichonephila clavipes]|nr:hypothetical protein TNCV_4426901 [Trichonephila clavipes]
MSYIVIIPELRKSDETVESNEKKYHNFGCKLMVGVVESWCHLCQLATCEDRRPRAGLDLPPYSIRHSVKRRQSVKLERILWPLEPSGQGGGWLVTSSSLVPLKNRRVGELCTLNLSRAQTSSHGSESRVPELWRRSRRLTVVQNYEVVNMLRVALKSDINIQLASQSGRS